MSQEGGSSQQARAIAGGGAVVLVGQLVGKGFRLLFRWLAAQLLGASGYGLVVLALTLAELAGRFGMLGMERAVLRYGAQHHGQGDRAAWTGVTALGVQVALAGGLAAGAGLWLGAPWLAEYFEKPMLRAPLEVAALSVPLMSAGLVAVSGLQALQQMRSYALWGFVMAAALGCALLLPSWWWGWGLEGAAAALAGGHVVAAVGSLVAAARRRARPAVAPAMGPLLRYGATMFVFMGAAQLVHQVDKLMVGALRSAEEVGVYDVAALLSSHIPLFLMALNAIVFPRIGAAWHAGRKDEVAQLFALETRWVVMCSAPLFLALSVLREPLMALFGEGFAEGGAAIAVLSLAQLINASAGPVGGVLMMTDKERWVLFNTLLLGGLNAAGNALLIPRWGIVGASISTACALACWNLVALLQVWLFHRIQPYTRRYIAPLLVFGVSCGVGFGLDAALPAPWGPWAATAAALLVYAALLWRFGLQPEDRQLPDALLRRLRRA